MNYPTGWKQINQPTKDYSHLAILITILGIGFILFCQLAAIISFQKVMLSDQMFTSAHQDYILCLTKF